ncbi:hypothetical protein MtrunA17_Chr7g0217731 [Medicago truncatula]|uniref:Transmembrane protein, putative n=1 Tax=Medicago truncatula TaxID=3880 RepID=A0A072U6Y3_MEDTR|nr:transmembrane protein, putative [Medicago truncatula]RHN44284.1 hypothetical protein MtrunA17_Chr7g0217731 [Medicago truncatula]
MWCQSHFGGSLLKCDDSTHCRLPYNSEHYKKLLFFQCDFIIILLNTNLWKSFVLFQFLYLTFVRQILSFFVFVGIGQRKMHICFAGLTKYMFIRHFKLMWYFFY